MTELPKGFWTVDFIAKMKQKELVRDIIDKSGSDTIQIIIEFTRDIGDI